MLYDSFSFNLKIFRSCKLQKTCYGQVIFLLSKRTFLNVPCALMPGESSSKLKHEGALLKKVAGTTREDSHQ